MDAVCGGGADDRRGVCKEHLMCIKLGAKTAWFAFSFRHGNFNARKVHPTIKDSPRSSIAPGFNHGPSKIPGPFTLSLSKRRARLRQAQPERSGKITSPLRPGAA
jgi:hypothetical protein